MLHAVKRHEDAAWTWIMMGQKPYFIGFSAICMFKGRGASNGALSIFISVLFSIIFEQKVIDL
jgi:hypothetical protein